MFQFYLLIQIFDGGIFGRFENMFFLSDKDNQTEIEKNVIDSDTEIKIDNNSNNNYNKEQDAEGTVVSNELRVEQITKLTNSGRKNQYSALDMVDL